MLPIGKILGLISIGGAIAESPLPRKLLSGMATVAGLTVVTGMMIGTLMVGALYAAYYALVDYGVSPESALVTVAGIATVITIILISVTVHYVKSLFEMPRLLPESQSSSIAGKVTGIADSFVDGLLTREVHHRGY